MSVHILPIVFLELSQPLGGRVADRADLLSTEQEAALAQELQALEHATSVQIAIATLPSLDGRPIEEVALQLAQTWALGQRGLDNGALVLVARDERQVRIEVGYGLEGTIPDALASRIIRERIAPRFREGDYAGGLLAAVQGLSLAARREDPSAPPPPAALPLWLNPERMQEVIGGFLACAFFWFLSFGILWDSVGLKRPIVPAFLTAFFTLAYLGITGWATTVIALIAVPAAFGIGWLLAPRFGRYMDRVTRTRRGGSWSSQGFSSASSWQGGLSSGGGSSGGSSGFSGGGGRFGGGGASGSW